MVRQFGGRSKLVGSYFIAIAMNVCLKARDSHAESLDADTGSGLVSWKLTHYPDPRRPKAIFAGFDAYF